MKKKKSTLQSQYCYQVLGVATNMFRYKAPNGLFSHAVYAKIFPKITKKWVIVRMITIMMCTSDLQVYP